MFCHTLERERVMLQTIHTVVFRDKGEGGNPCPVTLNADGLTTEEMQAMTKKFGVESVFLMKPTRSDCDIKARYFVPLHEMEMCIHATVGSATVLVEKGLVTKSPIVYETHFGPVRVDWKKKGEQIDVGVYQFLPKYIRTNPTPEEICRALRIERGELQDLPAESVATSRFKLIVPLSDKRVLYRLNPDFEFLWSLCDKYETTGFYPFAKEEENGETVFYARQFPKRAGYNEDPATGVAASALGVYLVSHEIVPVKEGWNSFTIYQGESMGRPSRLGSDCYVENGRILQTRVRGNAFLTDKIL